MRDAFVRTLEGIAQNDPNVFLVTGDLGFGVLTNFAKRFPKQYINAGVAEQNMTGLAVGMALEGKTVFTYSIGNFPTLRCLEQIRNDACYHQANVKIVAVGGGYVYGSLGLSHHATEDLAIMRALPNMTILAPGDPLEAAVATEAIYRTPGTCYLRLGRGGEPVVHQEKPDFKLGKAIQLFTGEDLTLISTGGILQVALEVRNQLAALGLKAGLISMPTLKPIDAQTIKILASHTKWIFTLEEHSVIGGLGSAVAEISSQLPPPKANLKMIGLPDGFLKIVGDQNYLRNYQGLSVEAILGVIQKELG
ncbi:MAG TPA: transketolase C-terminal domain-containing protein [Bacillota bacterium]|nr:transketolase C-terminal domain-containing protein [Bacillota bacterium]